ncbi:hypothetical protein PoB_007001400 [Plakobranchus ocellatus]|uniref:Uncharacterized protein n=1 Tax=Plakobranchus ocellatus TaxID=259542 RepID=A0AAV4DH57_9GAST|nr:hypothetical protein PoB_007001400 [Plakobranchus ocellatus]
MEKIDFEPKLAQQRKMIEGLRFITIYKNKTGNFRTIPFVHLDPYNEMVQTFRPSSGQSVSRGFELKTATKSRYNDKFASHSSAGHMEARRHSKSPKSTYQLKSLSTTLRPNMQKLEIYLKANEYELFQLLFKQDS